MAKQRVDPSARSIGRDTGERRTEPPPRSHDAPGTRSAEPSGHAPEEAPHPFSRGAAKLRAAVDHFALESVFEGARAIDVGAGYGGFTHILLECGAAFVTAIDVGHGQLAASLLEDPRVELLEGVHFKKAPLSIAPGPFDAFAVDVSFMAARTTLRPLALRCRARAEGVVLVKPQFELPKERVPRGGVIQSPNLRKFAFNRFKAKALAVGFEILGRIDCPVPGQDGNVEWLAHLRWSGRALLDRNAASPLL